MDADAMYRMGDHEYKYDELCDAIEAEAATLPPETWRNGFFNQRLHNRVDAGRHHRHSRRGRLT
jgi:hypothetical protein